MTDMRKLKGETVDQFVESCLLPQSQTLIDRLAKKVAAKVET
jgi:hypothetical protein